MKNKIICHMILLIIFFIPLTVCESAGPLNTNFGILNLKHQRTVENNIFTSSFPELKLQMNRELKYLGSVRIAEDTDRRIDSNKDTPDQSFEAIGYLFVQTDPRKRVTRGVLIRLLVAHGDPNQEVPELFTREHQNILESGETKIIRDTYQYEIYAEQEIFAPKEKELLKGFRVPPCLLVKQLSIRAGLGNKSRVQLIYFEDPSDACGNRPCGTCLAPRNRGEEQKQYFKGFIDRSFASIRFIETKTIEDTTSRYVDTVPKGQPAPYYEKAPTVTESSKADMVEKRLEALKRLHDRNLISQEEYDKKKAEILNEL